MKQVKIIFFLTFLILLGCKKESDTMLCISYYTGSDRQIELAAKEIQRYVYLRTGKLATIRPVSQKTDLVWKNMILLVTKGQYQNNISDLRTEQDYYLLSQSDNGLLILGSSPVGTLYGAYQFIESGLGIGFELQGDIIPDEKLDVVSLSGFDQLYTPSFNLRGIQPFHDFPEGPDYWTAEDYQAIVTQLPKMRMNFIGFHTYPEKEPFGGWERAEPNVWIGTEDEFNPDGTVKAAYPVLHANTNDSTWEYFPVMTSVYSFGASQLFDTDVFGTDFMKNTTKWPHTPEENIRIFNSMGKVLHNTFTWANELSVKTCLGTEIPVTIPNQLKDRLSEKGKDPQNPETRKEIYKGIFSRIMATHPLDYYWFWTPESWTWEGENTTQVKATELNLKLAQEAAEEVKAPFQLATCGWVLGPAHDRTAFDQLLPKTWPFSCINREQGFTPVEPGFEAIKDRPKWQISWIEDDPALTIPQLWAGRVRKDALDAYRYGCDGLMGIHWRTMILSPIFKSLADAGWNTASFDQKISEADRDYPVQDLYDDWADKWFGKEVGKAVADIFIKVDGGHLYQPGVNARTGKLPRPAEWGYKGPGTIVVNHNDWNEVKKQYSFIGELIPLRDVVKGDGNKSRFDYWINSFLYMQTMGEIGCMLGELEKNLEAAEKKNQPDEELSSKILDIRTRLAEKWGTMVTYLLETVHTKGELGTISNLEQHNLEAAKVLTKYDDKISKLTKREVPSLDFPKTFSGTERLVVTTRQSILHKNEDLRLQVAVLTNKKIDSVQVYYRSFGESTYKTLALQKKGGNVFEGYLSYQNVENENIEYYYEAVVNNQKLIYPVTSPQVNLSVLYW